MAKIQTYAVAKSPLSLSDMLIGTEVGGTIPNATKNFSLGDLLALFSSSLSPLTSKGDLFTFSTTNTRLPVGVDNQILAVDSTQATGLKWIDAPSTSPLTTKGDVYTFSTTNARLPIGVNGQFLAADSTQATGLKWVNAPSGTSPLIAKGDLFTYSTSNARLPIGTNGQLLSVDTTQATGLKWINSSAVSGFYAQYFSYATQLATTNNVGKAMIFETLDMSNGITVVTDGAALTKITFANAGKYNLQFSTQLQSLSNSPEDVYIWLRKNGTTSAADVAGSTGVVGMEARKGPSDPYHIIAGWNFLLDVNANDFYQIVWATTNVTAVEIRFYAATANHPSTASTLFTVTQPGGGAGSGGGAPAAPNGSVQYNNAGSFGGDSNFIWDNTSKRLGISTSSPLTSLDVRGGVHLGNGTPTASIGTAHTVEITSSTSNSPLTLIGGSGITEIWIDDTPTKAVSLGAGFPGAAADGDIHFVTYNLTSFWNQRLIIKNDTGNVGINNDSPEAKLHVLDGGSGVMGFPYEMSVFERNGDAKLGVFSSANTFTNNGVSIILGYTNVSIESANFPGFEFQYIGGNLPSENYVRYNYIERNTSGTVVAAVPDLLKIHGDGRIMMPYLPDVANSNVIGYDTATGELSFQPAGGGGGGGGISLPIPKVNLNGGVKSIQALDRLTGGQYSGGLLNLSKYPTVITTDLTESLLATYPIYVEMVHFKRKGKRTMPYPPYDRIRTSGYVVEPDIRFNEFGNRTWNVSWPSTFFTRNSSPCFTPKGAPSGGGVGISVNINRPNWYQVNSINQNIPVWEYLNSRFFVQDVAFRDTGANLDYLTTVVPVYGSSSPSKNVPTNRYPYSSYYTPLYVAFRYVAWDESANNGKGQIISGPLSRVVRISHRDFPFKYDFAASSAYGVPCASISDKYNMFQLQCFFETRLP